MMDYYSSFPMPDKLQRKKNLIDYANEQNIVVSDEIIDSIISGATVYSLTGYQVFGFREDCIKLMLLSDAGT